MTDYSDLIDHITEHFGDDNVQTSVSFGELTLTIGLNNLLKTIGFLRDDSLCKFTSMIDLCGVDFVGREQRFEVVYHFLSMHINQRIRVKVITDENTPVPSLIGLFPNANWYEREAFDMYGIVFDQHPDLRRLLTDYGFEGHPLRKDFPLTGFVEVRYDEERKSVIYEPVNLPQEFRDFDFMSPWEGAKYVLSDDKKGEGA